MGLIEETLQETISKKNWDFYRDHYLNGDYSFQDLVKINNLWYEALDDNRVFFHYKWLDGYLKKVVEFPARVVELGCFKGELAKQTLSNFEDIVCWDGYDICSSAVNSNICEDPRYLSNSLSCSFWNIPDIKFEIFVSTHTVEHLSNEEVMCLLNFIERNCGKGVYLEMPIRENGKKWRGGASSHVLELGRKHFRRFFISHGWKVVHESELGMDWSIGLVR